MDPHTRPRRGFVESYLPRLYGAGWPAALCHRLGLYRPLRVLQHALRLPRWPAGAPRLRLAFASDFHAGPTTHPTVLTAACAQLAAARPDVLLLGGDYIFIDAGYVDPLAAALAEIPAPAGKYAVLGNHDLWADSDHIVRRLREAGVQVLRNRAAALPAPFGHVSICGLDDAWVGHPDAAATFREAGPVRVLLMHAPSGLLSARGHAFDLSLCGHTHGGHIALPGGVPIFAPGPLSRRYNHGRHRLDSGATLIVSRGVGGIELPMRLFADPDILICDIIG